MNINHSPTRSSPRESPSTVVTTPDVEPDDDDIWASDNDNENPQAAAGDINREGMLSDLPSMRRQHMTDGYREGLAIGKAKVMQKGFDDGYPIGVKIALRVGKVLGCLEGVLATKDLEDEVKVLVRKMHAQAKQELAISSLMKDLNDEQVMQMNQDQIPTHVKIALQKWEDRVFGSGG